MNRTLVALLVSLVALPALAGCLGGDDDTPTTTEPGICEGDKCDPDKDLAEGFGKITGKVIDDAFNPIQGANVTLRELDLTTKTTADGKFAFNDLEPGIYTVFAQNPPTHKANGKQVEVIPNEPTPADIILELLPPPAEPYMVEDDKAGLIGCSVAYDPIRGNDRCREINQNADNQFNWPIDAYLTTVIVLLESDGGQLGSELAISVSKPVGIEPSTVTGSAPFQTQWDITEENAWPSWGVPSNITFDVRASHEASQPQVAYEQKIQLFVAFFYNGMPVPDGYTPKGDG